MKIRYSHVHEASRVPLKRVSFEMILVSCKSIKGKHRGACIHGSSDAYIRDSPTLLVIGEMFSEHQTKKAARAQAVGFRYT